VLGPDRERVRSGPFGATLEGARNLDADAGDLLPDQPERECVCVCERERVCVCVCVRVRRATWTRTRGISSRMTSPWKRSHRIRVLRICFHTRFSYMFSLAPYTCSSYMFTFRTWEARNLDADAGDLLADDVPLEALAPLHRVRHRPQHRHHLCRVQKLGFVGSGRCVLCAGCGVQGAGCRLQGAGCRAPCAVCRVPCEVCCVQGAGWGPCRGGRRRSSSRRPCSPSTPLA
jgi:hypothetical protein